MNADHLRTLVIRPTLQALDLWSPAAEALMIGTALHESLLTYLKQVGGGPALGIYQIEPATHQDVWRYLNEVNPTLGETVMTFAATGLSHQDQLISNLAYATAIARVRYWMIPDPLPKPDNLIGLAHYWKAHYNTPLAFAAIFQTFKLLPTVPSGRFFYVP